MNPEVTPEVTPEEDEVWNSVQFAEAIKDRNRAHLAAWKSVGEFMLENESKLAGMSPRQVYEQGFLAGYAAAKGRK